MTVQRNVSVVILGKQSDAAKNSFYLVSCSDPVGARLYPHVPACISSSALGILPQAPYTPSHPKTFCRVLFRILDTPNLIAPSRARRRPAKHKGLSSLAPTSVTLTLPRTPGKKNCKNCARQAVWTQS